MSACFMSFWLFCFKISRKGITSSSLSGGAFGLNHWGIVFEAYSFSPAHWLLHTRVAIGHYSPKTTWAWLIQSTIQPFIIPLPVPHTVLCWACLSAHLSIWPLMKLQTLFSWRSISPLVMAVMLCLQVFFLFQPRELFLPFGDNLEGSSPQVSTWGHLGKFVDKLAYPGNLQVLHGRDRQDRET